MIEVNELRRGNLVIHEGAFVFVGAISENTVKIYPRPPIINIAYVLVPIDVSDDLLEPILLTPEILGKAGFERQGVFYIKWALEIHERSFECWISRGFKARRVLYLHQLQNLYFALTGEELDINLDQQPNQGEHKPDYKHYGIRTDDDKL
jgi:hypothetical protein